MTKVRIYICQDQVVDQEAEASEEALAEVDSEAREEASVAAALAVDITTITEASATEDPTDMDGDTADPTDTDMVQADVLEDFSESLCSP